MNENEEMVLNKIEQKVAFNIKRFESIRKKDNVKMYGLNWKNDKRQINYDSDINHIRTKPLEDKFDMMKSYEDVFGFTDVKKQLRKDR